MTYYLKESEWYQSVNVPEGMNLDMMNMPNRLTQLLIPAIDQLESGKVFIDLGCGTGALGLHALKNGAKFVYFVEKDTQMFHIIKNLLPKKIDSDKFKLINKDIEELSIDDFNYGVPEVVVSEFYGPRLFDEGYVNYTKHIRSLFPKCEFIPQKFVAEFYLSNIDYSQPIWPVDPEFIDHYKFMYKTKGFSRHIEFPTNSIRLGKITFDANTQEFINSLIFDCKTDANKLLYGRMIIQHNELEQYYTSIGWVVDNLDNKKFEVYFDETNYFNPRLIEKENANEIK
jgi:SAM-dependent methyltransferase